MDINQTIRNCIAESNATDPSDDEIQSIMTMMLSIGTWEQVRECLLGIVYDNDQSLWRETILYLYYFQNNGYTYEAVTTIALLYNCLTLCDELDENLIWTITKTIKSKSYLSEYDPFQDPDVVREMRRIEELRERG